MCQLQIQCQLYATPIQTNNDQRPLRLLTPAANSHLHYHIISVEAPNAGIQLKNPPDRSPRDSGIPKECQGVSIRAASQTHPFPSISTPKPKLNAIISCQFAACTLVCECKRVSLNLVYLGTYANGDINMHASRLNILNDQQDSKQGRHKGKHARDARANGRGGRDDRWLVDRLARHSAKRQPRG